MWQMRCKCHLCLLPHVSRANYMLNVARLPMRQLWDRYNYARWRQQKGESTSSTVIIHMMDHIFASNNLMSTRVCISVEITGSNKTLKSSTSHDQEPHTHTFKTAFYKHQTLKLNHNATNRFYMTITCARLCLCGSTVAFLVTFWVRLKSALQRENKLDWIF